MSSSKPPRRRKKRGPGRPPRSESRHTRGDILQAAEHLFAREGYHNTSLRSIAKASNVDLATIKYHYKDKRTLYNEAFLLGHRRIAEGFIPEVGRLTEVTTAEDLEAALLEITERSLRLADNDQTFVRLLFFRVLEGLQFSDNVVHAYVRDISKTLREHLEVPTERNLIRSVDADAFAMMIFVTIPAIALASKTYRGLDAFGASDTVLNTSAVERCAQQLLNTLVLNDATEDAREQA